jgi:acetate---CoA ligase (ADP-forming)
VSVAAASLRPLFEPRSIAFVGASRNPASLGRRALRHVIRHGYAGDVHLVHPTADEIEGIAAVRSLDALDAPPDLVFVCTDGDRVLGVIEEAVDAGVPAVAAIAASGAIVSQRDEVLELLGNGTRMLGPNAPGFLSLDPPVTPHISNFLNRPKLQSAPIGLITHSGAVGGVLGDQLLRAGVGLDWLICTGNEFDVGMGECLEYLAERDLRAIGLFVEAVRDREAFLRGLARAAEHGIRVLAVKVGRSAAGARQALTHTGALTGDSALFERELIDAGGTLCDSLEELASALAVASLPAPPVRSVAVAAASGGLAGLIGDLAARAGVAVPDLGDLPNPWDTDVQILDDPEGAADRWRAMLERPEVGAGLLGLGSLPDAAMLRIADALAARPVGKPVVIVPGAGMPAEVLERLRGQAISIPDARLAVEALAWRTEGVDGPPAAPHSASAQGESAGDGSASGAAGATSPPDAGGGLAVVAAEDEAKRLLAAAGVPVPNGRAVATAAAAADFAAGARPPFVLKCLRPALAHKAAAGGVRLGLDADPDAIAAAWSEMAAAVEAATGKPLEAALIEEQASPGLELIVAAAHDPDHGAYLTVGAGGGGVERDPDVAHLLLPADRAAVERALAGLRVGGALGQAAAAAGDDGPAPAALVDVVLAVGRVAAERPGATVEVNPVILPFGGPPIAVDCVIAEDRGD